MVIAVDKPKELITTFFSNILKIRDGGTLLLSGLLRYMAPNLVSISPTTGYYITKRIQRSVCDQYEQQNVYEQWKG